jgi:hypothetical protein
MGNGAIRLSTNFFLDKPGRIVKMNAPTFTGFNVGAFLFPGTQPARFLTLQSHHQNMLSRKEEADR